MQRETKRTNHPDTAHPGNNHQGEKPSTYETHSMLTRTEDKKERVPVHGPRP